MKFLARVVVPFFVALALLPGCSSDETHVVETTVSEEDRAYQEEVLDEYSSPEYAKSRSGKSP